MKAGSSAAGAKTMTRGAPTNLRAEEAHYSAGGVVAAASAVDSVIDAIRRGIRHGRYVLGQRLAEPDLMREFHVSRGSVREALRRLEAEGLVQIELYRGATIRKISRAEFVEANQIRALLEGYAASLAAERITAAEGKRLREIERRWNRGDDWTYAEYNERFHALILKAAHHDQLPRFLEQANVAVFRLQFHRIRRTPAAVRRSTLEHARVVKAILKGDAKAADRAMRQHVENSGRAILDAPEEFFSD